MGNIRKDTDGNDPMIGIVWYNGLENIVIKWKDYKENDDVPYREYKSSLKDSDYSQLQMVWMYLVLCFGNYGTSPRSGWIEDFKGYYKWFDELEDLMGPLYDEKIFEEGKLELSGAICTNEELKTVLKKDE